MSITAISTGNSAANIQARVGSEAGVRQNGFVKEEQSGQIRPDMSTVTVELAEEFFFLAKTNDAAPSRSAAKLLALELFREHRVSAGKAAELAGISLEEFMEFAAQREVPLHYTEADWEQDQKTIRELKL